MPKSIGTQRTLIINLYKNHSSIIGIYKIS